MTTSRDDAAASSSFSDVGEASVFPGLRGMRWWAVMLFALVLTAAGVAVDVVRAGGLGAVFLAAYPGGCVLAALLVQRRDLFVPMVQPPLLLAVSVPVAVATTGSLPASGGTVSTALAVGAPMINGFPAMAITTVVCIVIGAVRIRLQRWRSPDDEPTRRDLGRPGPPGSAARERSGPSSRERPPSGRDERQRRDADREQAERDRRRAQERARAERDRERAERDRERAERDRLRRDPAREKGEGTAPKATAPKAAAPGPKTQRGAPASARPPRDEPRSSARRSSASPGPAEREAASPPARRSPGRAIPKSERPTTGGPGDPGHGGPAPSEPGHGGPAPSEPGHGDGPGPRDPRTREERMRDERLREERERRGPPKQPPPGVHPMRERRPEDRAR